MSFDRGAPTPVVQNAHQAKQEPDRGPPWYCPLPCGHQNISSASHCTKCGVLRPDERAIRMQARAIQGLGRGGGYFERSDATDRREVEDESEFDDFGRRRRKLKEPKEDEAAPTAGSSSAAGGSGPRNGLLSAPALPSKAERQKAALERLRNPNMKKAGLSPPRGRSFRDQSSRSRSREKKKKISRGFVLSGGIQ
mmetsp:Transcript_54675/g.140763  ORF Transcript_54675/g.140763 Transcript_54675/m.140763 type:complete len:195 (-) Transcript_54675:49-633(-)